MSCNIYIHYLLRPLRMCLRRQRLLYIENCKKKVICNTCSHYLLRPLITKIDYIGLRWLSWQ